MKLLLDQSLLPVSYNCEITGAGQILSLSLKSFILGLKLSSC